MTDMAGCQLSSALFGDIIVPNIEYYYILLLGYSISYEKCNLTSFYHQRNATQLGIFLPITKNQMDTATISRFGSDHNLHSRLSIHVRSLLGPHDDEANNFGYPKSGP